jgi:hypothetical protein
MAAGTFWFHEGLASMAKGDIIWKAGSGQTFKCALLKNTITLDATAQRTYNAYDDLTPGSNEVTSANYTARGNALTPADPTIVNDTTYKVFIMQNHASTVWSGPCTFTARYAVIYKDTGVDSTSLLIAYLDFGSDQVVSSGSFTIDWDNTTTFKIAPSIFA